MTNPNDVLPDDVALKFGKELWELATGNKPNQRASVWVPPGYILESLGRIAFKRSLEIAEQIDFGSEDVR